MDPSFVDRYRRFLAAKQKRLTHERAIILEFVSEQRAPFSAEDLVTALCDRHGSRAVSRATVYRTLHALVEASIVRELKRFADQNAFLTIHHPVDP